MPTAAYLVVRRILATALERQQVNGRRSQDLTGTSEAWSFTAGISSVPGTASDRATLYREAEAALLTARSMAGRSSRSTSPSATRRAPSIARSPGSGAEVARVAAAGALVAVFQPIFDLRTGNPRGFEGLVRPMPGSGFADPSSCSPRPRPPGGPSSSISPA